MDNGSGFVTKPQPERVADAQQREPITAIKRDIPKFSTPEREGLSIRYATLVSDYLEREREEVAGHTYDGTELRQAQEIRAKNLLSTEEIALGFMKVFEIPDFDDALSAVDRLLSKLSKIERKYFRVLKGYSEYGYKAGRGGRWHKTPANPEKAAEIAMRLLDRDREVRAAALAVREAVFDKNTTKAIELIRKHKLTPADEQFLPIEEIKDYTLTRYDYKLLLEACSEEMSK
ncbi:MAG: hypothetical protein ACHQX1_00445 [Candidatus Micrarchaeales archaeon]